VEIRSGCFERKGQTYYLGLVRDLTLRKQADESIRLLHHAIEQTPAIVVITDLRGNIEYVNRQFVLSTGYSIEEVRGKNPRLLKSGKMAASFYQQLWQTITAGNDWSGEFLNRRKDGGLYWEQAVISPLKNPDGRVTHFVGVKQDITAQKTFEEKIGEQARLINEALDAIILNDMEGTILLWNHGAEATFGWPSPEALGKKLAGFLKHDPLKYEAAWRELLEKGRWTGELAAQTRDGRRITIDSRLTMLRGEDGGPQKILTICHDVTAQKEMEARYLRAQRQQTLGTLSGGVAHDLNNILAPFLVGLPLIRAEISNPEVQQLVSMMETSVQRGADIVKQLLLFGRGSAPQRVPLGMDRPVREVEKIIRETFPKNLVLRTSWSESLWPVLGDPTQIYQALLNICVNARDAMPAGGTLTISLKNRELDTSAATLNPRAKPGSYVVLSVRDTGGGITPEVQDRMFEPFFTTKDVGEGTGLGLSVVLGVVESHGGFVNVNSQVGAGTEFVIYLPAQLVPPEESPAGQTAQLAAGRGELVLLVDDEPAIRKVVGKILERSGYRVLLADGGAEALELHAQHGNEIKVVVSDYSMPDMDGLALAEALHKSRPDLKIIIGSGLGQNLDESLFLAQGVVRILRKPFAAQTILTALRETLDGSAALRPEL
jgi:PAS domain S-box-containing protein